VRKIGEWLLKRTSNAAAVAFLLTLTPLVGFPGGFIASILVGFVTLCRGARPGLFVLAWVAIPALALLYLHRFGVFDLILLRSALVWLLAVVLLRLRSWRSVFEVAAIIGVVAVLVLHSLMPDLTAWWIHYLTKYITEANRMMTSMKITTEQAHHLIHAIAPMATGVATFVILFGSWLMLFISRWWQLVIFQSTRLRQEFIGIRNRQSTGVIALAGAIGVWLQSSVVIDIFPILLLPLMMGGLSFLHFLSTFKKGFIFLEILIYLGLLFLPFFVVALLAIIGFFDIWVNYRKYFTLGGETA